MDSLEKMDLNDENDSIMKEMAKIEIPEDIAKPLSILTDYKDVIPTIIKKKGRPKKQLTEEELEFREEVRKRTEAELSDKLERQVKNNIKKELKIKALEEDEIYKAPEAKQDIAMKKKKVLSIKQLEALNKGRAINIAKKSEQMKKDKTTISEQVKTVKDAKRIIRKSRLEQKIREEIERLSSDEDEEEKQVIITKKPKLTVKKEIVEIVEVVNKPTISFY